MVKPYCDLLARLFRNSKYSFLPAERFSADGHPDPGSGSDRVGRDDIPNGADPTRTSRTAHTGEWSEMLYTLRIDNVDFRVNGLVFNLSGTT